MALEHCEEAADLVIGGRVAAGSEMARSTSVSALRGAESSWRLRKVAQLPSSGHDSPACWVSREGCPAEGFRSVWVCLEEWLPGSRAVKLPGGRGCGYERAGSSTRRGPCCN